MVMRSSTLGSDGRLYLEMSFCEPLRVSGVVEESIALHHLAQTE